CCKREPIFPHFTVKSVNLKLVVHFYSLEAGSSRHPIFSGVNSVLSHRCDVARRNEILLDDGGADGIRNGSDRFVGTSLGNECAVLEALYDSSGKAIPWKRGSCCTELGTTPQRNPSVSCSASGHITGISLSNQELSAAFPSFACMPQLTWLALDGNSIMGPIPQDAFWMLWSLYHLDVRNNKLTGSLPSFAGTSVVELQIEGNNFSGEIDGRLPWGLKTCGLLPGNSGLFTTSFNYPDSCSAVPLSKTPATPTQPPSTPSQSPPPVSPPTGLASSPSTASNVPQASVPLIPTSSAGDSQPSTSPSAGAPPLLPTASNSGIAPMVTPGGSVIAGTEIPTLSPQGTLTGFPSPGPTGTPSPNSLSAGPSSVPSSTLSQTPPTSVSAASPSSTVAGANADSGGGTSSAGSSGNVYLVPYGTVQESGPSLAAVAGGMAGGLVALSVILIGSVVGLVLYSRRKQARAAAGQNQAVRQPLLGIPRASVMVASSRLGVPEPEVVGAESARQSLEDVELGHGERLGKPA
ncbi:hypothetical protein HDU93_004110, partial [Gonapodya sp. JEL0774]